MYPVVKIFWQWKWRYISGEYDNSLRMDLDQIPSWKCWLARIILILRIIFLIPFWTLHLFSLLIDRFNFMKINISGNKADDDDEDEWLGRALDTERRVKKIVDNMRDEMKTEISATNGEISGMKTEISATNAKIDAILKALKIES